MLGRGRSAKAEELWLVATFGSRLTIEWQAMTRDPRDVATVMATMRSALPGRQRREAAAAMSELAEAGQLRKLAGDPEDFPMLLAATRWFGDLALPRTPDDLWVGPTIARRERSDGEDGKGRQA
jgi:hypothetical protein